MTGKNTVSEDFTPTIVKLAGCTENTLCIGLHGLIKKQDHENILCKGLADILDEHENYNLLVHYTPDYQGWELDAADSSMKSIVEYGPKARKLAYVNPPERKIMQNKLIPFLLGGEIRYFEDNQLQEALDWVNC